MGKEVGGLSGYGAGWLTFFFCCLDGLLAEKVGALLFFNKVYVWRGNFCGDLDIVERIGNPQEIASSQ